MSRFQARKLVSALSLTGFIILSSHAMASGFQLWEQDAASVGNYHAGYAAAAYDASTAFYNPAGLSRFKEQQLVLAGDNIFSSFKYRGTVRVNSIGGGLEPEPVTAQGGNFGFVPALHYVAPLSDIFAFGFSVDVPFGLKVNYGYGTWLRYASTKTSVNVVDLSPVLSIKVNEHVSIGFGPDIQFMKGEFNSVGTLGGAFADSSSVNSASGVGYGMHAGVMYEFNENTRAGLSYHSQVAHHLSGTSTLSGPLAPDDYMRSGRARLNMTLPGYTALSAYHKMNSMVAIMGSIIYTQWNVLQNLVLQNVSGLTVDGDPSRSLVVTIPQHFRNTFSVSVGADYFVTDTVTLRGGFGIDQTPVRNAYRNVQLPDSNRFAIALGTHFQSTPTLGFDLGWTHLFMNPVTISPPPQVAGGQVVYTNGTASGGADVLAAQLVWDMV